MNPVLDELLTTKFVRLPDGTQTPLHSGLAQLEGALLQTWVEEAAPEEILEIGFAYGISSLFICQALEEFPHTKLTIIDPFQQTDWKGGGIENLARAGFGSRYCLVEERSEICLPRFLSEGRRFDFAFVDGFHTFDHALLDFFYINRMLNVGGRVIFDDVRMPSIQKLLSYITGYPGYKPVDYPQTFLKQRVIRIRKMMNIPLTNIGGFEKISEDERKWDWYHEF